MNLYLTIKWIHILSSVVLVGTGLGTAYFMFFTNRSANVAAQAVVTRLVVRADWWFTTPAVFMQLSTGLLLAYLSGWPLSTPWLVASLVLFFFAGACWLPVVWLQLRMAGMAQDAFRSQAALPAIYWRYSRWWEFLGYPAFLAMVLVFYLMAAKPGFSA